MTPRLIAVGRRLIGGLEAVRVRIQPCIDAWLERSAMAGKEREQQGFAADTDYAILQQEPLRARIVLRTVGIAFAIAVMWAAVSRIDEVTRGEGKVIPSRQLQVLQSLDGGVVSEILVREGDVVEPEQILLRIDQTRFVSSVRESRAQTLALQAKAARLRALAESVPFVLPPEVAKDDPKTAAEERRLYESRRDELQTTQSIARQQLSQRQQELAEARARHEQAAKAYEFSSKELSVTKPLIGSGAVSEVELLRLERDVSRFRGERDMAAAQIARIQSAISEASHKVEEVALAFRNEAGKELAETMARLNSLSEGSVGLADKVDRAVLRSPVKGTVKRLLVNTVGGVVQPGKDIVEVVPLEDTLLIPYFEVDLANPNGRDTLITVQNASATALLAHTVVWSDEGVASAIFDIYLTGYDIQAFSMRDVLNGALPETASATATVCSSRRTGIWTDVSSLPT